MSEQVEKETGVWSELLRLAAATLLVWAWIEHCAWTVRVLSAGGADGGQIALGIFGAILPPVGMIHGLILLFLS